MVNQVSTSTKHLVKLSKHKKEVNNKFHKHGGQAKATKFAPSTSITKMQRCPGNSQPQICFQVNK